jgi:hypothetical protein
MNYEPPCTKAGSPLIPGNEGRLAVGVRGYAIKEGEVIYIPLICAEKEGSGDVGRFLDSLSPRCVVPNVTSPRLRGMLERRGWTSEHDGEVDIWKRVTHA